MGSTEPKLLYISLSYNTFISLVFFWYFHIFRIIHVYNQISVQIKVLCCILTFSVQSASICNFIS